MAKIVEEMLVVKVSTLLKEGTQTANSTLFSDEMCDALEGAIAEMVGLGHVVEIIKE